MPQETDASEEFNLKQRLITAGGGLAVLVVAILFFNTWLLNFLAAFICVVAVYELLDTAGFSQYRLLIIVSMLYCVKLLFLNFYPIVVCFFPGSILYIILGFCYLLIRHEALSVNGLCYCFLTTILVALSFYSLLKMRDESTSQLGLFYMILTFGSAWWSDSGAYFVGTFFGKHKLCPAISAKKTIEGFIGGIVTAIFCNLLICWIFVVIADTIVPLGYFTQQLQVNFWRIAMVSPILSLLGVLGDLSASIIKRQNGVKDFGTIMPGHGGIMDRFDSMIFISPVVFWIFRNFPLVVLI